MIWFSGLDFSSSSKVTFWIPAFSPIKSMSEALAIAKLIIARII